MTALHVAMLAGLLLVARAIAPRRRRHSLRYRLYLNSPIGRARRRLWIIRGGGRCQHCHRRRRLTIHHRTYAGLGRERPSDIAVLCWSCHQRQDAWRR